MSAIPASGCYNNHAIDIKEGFVPRKGKVYPLSREESKEVRKFIEKQLRNC